MKPKLSAWWEDQDARYYVAKRSLITLGQTEKFAPLTRFIIYYCGARFSPEKVESNLVGLKYLIEGEKEPFNAMEDNPWSGRAEQLIGLVGGAIRQEEPEIIPILYVSMAFAGEHKTLEFTSDQVPISENANHIVRVICGKYKNVAHIVSSPKDVTVLDIVINQGGNFTWQLPLGCRGFIYVISGNVQIGKKESFSNCQADTLVWAIGKLVHVTAACAGGRFLLVTLPNSSVATQQEEYVQEVLPILEQKEN